MQAAELKRLNIAILGAGYGGATAAIALKRAGAENVHIYEQAREIRQVGAGIGLRPATVELFRQWGIFDAIAAVSAPSDYLEILAADGQHVLAREEWPGIRDFAQVAALGIPSFSAGPHPAVLGRRHVPWETDVTIACGGAAVQPGDIMVGDDDGVLVIPPALAREVAEAAVEQERQERFITEQVAGGASVDGLYPMNAQWRARYAEWDG